MDHIVSRRHRPGWQNNVEVFYYRLKPTNREFSKAGSHSFLSRHLFLQAVQTGREKLWCLTQHPGAKPYSSPCLW
ncbi:Condensin-2 Complex Subunit G2 [Manis pentadactyla]|nr:Condensin-2 Complex Subunit G2 [Manis pentadactyla]